MNISINFRVILALLLVITPVFFVWHIELATVPRAVVIGFTNGFFDFSISQIYHLSMYLMLFITFLSAYYLINGVQKPTDSVKRLKRMNDKLSKEKLDLEIKIKELIKKK